MTDVTVKFNHWLPRLFNAGGVTIGHTIYFRENREWFLTTPNGWQLFKHEMIHTEQYDRAGGVLPFLWIYFFQWVRAGFKYRDIAYEQYAYGQQHTNFTEHEARQWQRWFT